MVLIFMVIIIVMLVVPAIIWIGMPLYSITKALKKEDLSYVKSLQKDRSEFGEISRLICKFFKQKQELLNEIAKRKQTEEKLNNQNMFLNTVLESFTHPFYVIDANDYSVMLANSAAKEGFPDEISTCYKLTHKSDKPCSKEHICPLEEVKRTRKSVVVEHLHYDKNGVRKNMEVRGYPIFDSDGNVVRMIEYSTDITERKRSEEELKNYTLQLEEINRELDDFTYIVSHDLKEPLRSIHAFSRFIEDDYKDKLDSQGNIYLERIKINAARMQNLIEDLLEVSRIERKKSFFEKVKTEELIAEVKLRLEYAIKQKGAEIIIKDKLPGICCDKVRLTEVFLNLISNAIKFNDKPKVSVEIGVNSNAVFHEFYVRDNGPGIEEQYFDKIFKIFQRLGKREDCEGTGVGLTIAKKIVEMHKGRIWLESKVGEGTTFYFTIPENGEVLDDRGSQNYQDTVGRR